MATLKPSDATRPPESTATATDTPPVAPEVFTPETALSWNRYYDRYVAGGVLLLVFLVSAHKITGVSSRIWPLMKAGQLTVSSGRPLTTDIFSFTEAGKPWVNVPWVYEVVNHALYTWGLSGSQSLLGAAEPMSVQIGSGILVCFNALARLLTVWLLLRIRRPGPGLWWYAVVGAVALGCVYSPRDDVFEWSVGGIARQANIGPETFGQLLLALTVFLIDRGFDRGKTKLLYALPFVFLLWANLDESFVFGLFVLLASGIGALLSGRRKRSGEFERPAPATIVAVVAGSFLACLLNPSTYHIYPHALAPYLAIPKIWFGSETLLPMSEHLSFIGSISFDFLANRTSTGGPLTPRYRLFYFAAIVILGFVSFWTNRRNFNLGRFLAYVTSAILWAGISRLSAEFAIVFAYVVAVNGQEWYLDNYGTEGRTTPNWTAWSVGGRAVTILVFFLVMAKTLTGYEYTVGRPTFGFGMEPSEFDFEAADHLKTLKLSGEVMNLGEALGDSIIWRGYPLRKTFIDRRRGLFPEQVRADIAKFREAFQADEALTQIIDDPAVWAPVLDKYNVSAVIYSPEENLKLFLGMRKSKNWIALRDDGRTVLFGRADAKVAPEDLALFKASRLDAWEIVYRRKELLPVPDRSPSAMTFIDQIIRNRSLTRKQPHIDAADRWLAAGAAVSKNSLPDAAHALMAIREARIAIAANPDDTKAYRILEQAYRILMTNETDTMSGKITGRPNEYVNFRARQRVTALNFAIQTTPPPRTVQEKAELAQTHLDLAIVHREVGDLDLERDNLAAARALLLADEFPTSELQRLESLDDAIERFKDELQKYATEVGADGPQRALRAISAGFPGIALRELEEAESQGVSTDRILSMLVDLYNRTGQPEKANERVIGRTVTDQALFSGPGTPAYRLGTVNFLLGYYDNTISLWRDYAMGQSRGAQTNTGLNLGRELISGQALSAVNNVLSLTGLPGQQGLLEVEANWAAELGFCLLESGDPKQAGEHFAEALKLNPKILIRPLLEDYLTKLGVPIPADPAAEAKPADAKPEEAKPAAEDPAVPAPAAAPAEPKPEVPK